MADETTVRERIRALETRQENMLDALREISTKVDELIEDHSKLTGGLKTLAFIWTTAAALGGAIIWHFIRDWLKP